MAMVELRLGSVGERDRRSCLSALGDVGTARAAGWSVTVAIWYMGGDRIRGRECAGDRVVLGIVVRKHSVERHPERRLGLGQRDAVLRALGPSDARSHFA